MSAWSSGEFMEGQVLVSSSERVASVTGLQLPICGTCGVQYGAPRADCPICLDERQYVGWDGQQWTTLAELRAGGRRGRLDEEGPGVIGVGAVPSVAVGQRALLIRSPSGNVLWDCVGYLDDDLAAEVEELGGISAIAVSHPHFYGVMTEWGRAFEAPVYVHAADRDWVGRPDPVIEYWTGDTHQIAPGMTLINAGTHFAGGTVPPHRDPAHHRVMLGRTGQARRLPATSSCASPRPGPPGPTRSVQRHRAAGPDAGPDRRPLRVHPGSSAGIRP